MLDYVDRDESMQTLAGFLQPVQAQLTISFFTSPQDLAAKMTADLACATAEIATIAAQTGPCQVLQVLMLVSQLLVTTGGRAVPALQVREEARLVRERLAELDPPLDLRICPASTDNLLRFLQQSAQVLHFSGHGDENILSFEDAIGVQQPVSAAQLAHLLQGHPQVRLVVLSACHSASLARKLLAAGVPAVIAIEAEQTVLDQAAIVFSRGFYPTLAERLLAAAYMLALKHYIYCRRPAAGRLAGVLRLR